jgi:DNA modification methylase
MTWDGRIRADARHLPIADSCVQCVVTSPPYWGLRDYKQDGQIGLEKTPREYLNHIREVAYEVWRVLRSDGTFWLNLGDSYARSWGAQGRQGASGQMASRSVVSARQIAVAARKTSRTGSVTDLPGIKAKDLIGIPWRVAFALQEDGWYLRRDIIWHKPNPMPESVTDRPTSSHEYIFLLTKSARYFYDADAIKEPVAEEGRNAFRAVEDWRNKRSVWTISTQPYPEAHYATFPEEIPELCIKAGSRPGDCVLDPFGGSGTVAKVAERLNRRWLLCDLGYQDLQAKRLRNVQKVLV